MNMYGNITGSDFNTNACLVSKQKPIPCKTYMKLKEKLIPCKNTYKRPYVIILAVLHKKKNKKNVFKI